VTPTSYVLLVGVLLTWTSIVCSLGVSAVADHGRRAKKLTLFFTAMLCLINSLIFMGALWPGIWWFCGLNYVLGKSLTSS
jgi:UMF1 family MFS transporter